MYGSPPYTVRIPEEDLEIDAEDMSGAIIAASAMYDPSVATPEIIDEDGTIVLDQTQVVAKITRYRLTGISHP